MSEQVTDTYRRWVDVPARLKTRTQLNEMGLRPAKGQEPAAIFDSRNGDWKLYDLALAIPKRKMTEAQEASLAKARDKVDGLRRCLYYGKRCGEELSLEDYGDWKRQRIRVAKRERDEDISKVDHQYICRHCRYRLRASEWAREALADETAIILDTETTGLDESAEIVEIAIISIKGETLFESLVKPHGAMAGTHIHGITAEDVSAAPTWLEIDSRVAGPLRLASRVIVYNAEYDYRLIRQTQERWQIKPLEGSDNWQCAMEEYAQWYGNWNDYHKSYKWQRLEGGHRALSDCLACLEYIKRMAEDKQ